MQAKLCVNENILVVPIPGPCALISALSASGLATDEFAFGNFCLPLLVDPYKNFGINSSFGTEHDIFFV